MPHLKRLPSEYIREHVYVCHPADGGAAPAGPVPAAARAFGAAIDRIVFATDYPHWDCRRRPTQAFPVALPPELQQKIYFENAAQLYRLG